MKTIEIYTDGACSGNPGKGGWGALLMFGENYKEIYGGENFTTNNRMELLAVIKGIQTVNQTCNINVYSDSAYVVNAFQLDWISGWKKRNFNKVKNLDLWQTLIELTTQHNVTFIKVKGHSDNIYNNRCDELARQAITEL